MGFAPFFPYCKIYIFCSSQSERGWIPNFPTSFSYNNILETVNIQVDRVNVSNNTQLHIYKQAPLIFFGIGAWTGIGTGTLEHRNTSNLCVGKIAPPTQGSDSPYIKGGWTLGIMGFL